MKKVLGVCVALLLLSGISFGTNYYWVGATSNDWGIGSNWSTTSGGAGGAVVPGVGDCVTFDSHSSTTNKPNMGTFYNVKNLNFNVPGGYGITAVAYRGIGTVTAVNLMTADAYTMTDELDTVAGTSNNVTVNTVANSTLTVTGVNGSTLGSATQNLTGNGLLVVHNMNNSLATSIAIWDQGTVNITGSTGSYDASLYNVTNNNGGTLRIMNDCSTIGRLVLFSAGTSRTTGVGSVGAYSMTAPIICMPITQPGSNGHFVVFDYTPKGSGTQDNGTIRGLKLQLLSTDATHYAEAFCGTTKSLTGGKNLDFTNARFSGNSRIAMFGDITVGGVPAGGAVAYTLRARGTEFAPDNATSPVGILRIVGNLRLMDNQDLPSQPSTLTININHLGSTGAFSNGWVSGVGAGAGNDYSQLQVNKVSAGVGGILSGIENMTLAVNLTAGLDPTALKNEQITVLSSDATDFSLLGKRFADDAGGVNGWSYGGYKGTLTYNAMSGGTSTVVLSNVAAVPEPATLFLLGTGAIGAIGWLRRRRVR